MRGGIHLDRSSSVTELTQKLPSMQVYGIWEEETMQNKCWIISSFYLDSRIPRGGVQTVIRPAHFTDGIIMAHQRVMPPAERDGIEITRREEDLG